MSSSEMSEHDLSEIKSRESGLAGDKSGNLSKILLEGGQKETEEDGAALATQEAQMTTERNLLRDANTEDERNGRAQA